MAGQDRPPAAAGTPGRDRLLTYARGAILAYFALFATAFAVLVPPFEAPDEPAHLAYVDFVAARGELPNQVDPQRALTGYGPVPTEGHQPPLYYALAALLLRLTAGPSGLPPLGFASSGEARAAPAPNPEHAWNGGTRTDVPLLQHPAGEGGGPAGERAPFFLLRLFSVGLGLLNVAVVLEMSRHLFPGRWQLLPAVFVATLPQDEFMSGAITNDGLANLLVTLCLLGTVYLLEAPERPRAYLLLGGALGLALVTKQTSLFLLPGLALLVGYLVWRHPCRRGRILGLAGAMLGVTTLLSGWYFLRSTALYGDPLGSQMEKSTLAALVQEKSPLSPYFRGPFPVELGQSFVGRFGWMQVSLPDPVYPLYGLLLGLCAAGVLSAVAGRRFPAPQAGFAALFLLSCFAGIIALNLTYSQPQGRFLFPVLSLVGVLFGAGLRELLRRLPRPQVAALLAGLVGGFVVVDVLGLLTVVQFYGRTGLFAWTAPA